MEGSGRLRIQNCYTVEGGHLRYSRHKGLDPNVYMRRKLFSRADPGTTYIGLRRRQSISTAAEASEPDSANNLAAVDDEDDSPWSYLCLCRWHLILIGGGGLTRLGVTPSRYRLSSWQGKRRQASGRHPVDESVKVLGPIVPAAAGGHPLGSFEVGLVGLVYLQRPRVHYQRRLQRSYHFKYALLPAALCPGRRLGVRSTRPRPLGPSPRYQGQRRALGVPRPSS